ncbi:hypothetical protein EI546_10790 [Aequorivita sp. H23M31]|uniref:Uncharacterized protein n=1 Tax=Aequorivita ciconiae TaxID=2494375 RepID=A0A410G4K9_9FLAO|nr:hypothetical protein [Aequorivita sp. H23M31]QAA82179.1 hypothetical protein EI546_10790 [Aequorivita sp. H23M31]
MNNLDLQNVERELKKRRPYPYKWFRKQNDQWDGLSNFIYHTADWDELLDKIKQVLESQNLEKEEFFQYVSNRWYNFWSAKAVEHIFTQIEGVNRVNQVKDSEKDFYLFGIPFDHKTSVFPNGFGKSFEYAKSNKPELIQWFYKNQSTQQRHHLKNRLFVVVYSSTGNHWKLKSEISLLKRAIESYVSGFNPEKLCSFNFSEEEQTLSDVIWICK